jgi:hypothetical protein
MLFEKQAFNDSICLFNESLLESPSVHPILVLSNFRGKTFGKKSLSYKFRMSTILD